MCHTLGTPASHAAGPAESTTPAFVCTRSMRSRRTSRHIAKMVSGRLSRNGISRHERKTPRVITLTCGKKITFAPVRSSSASSGPCSGSTTTP